MAEENVVIPASVFWKRKVDKYVQLWEYGGCNDEQFQKNLIRMGYEEETIENLIHVYNNNKE